MRFLTLLALSVSVHGIRDLRSLGTPFVRRHGLGGTQRAAGAKAN